jgi:hypothetical protein
MHSPARTKVLAGSSTSAKKFSISGTVHPEIKNGVYSCDSAGVGAKWCSMLLISSERPTSYFGADDARRSDSEPRIFRHLAGHTIRDCFGVSRPRYRLRNGQQTPACHRPSENGGVMPRRFCRRLVVVTVYQVMTVENRKPWPCASRVLEPARPLGLEVPRAPVVKSNPPWWRWAYCHSPTSWTPGASL